MLRIARYPPRGQSAATVSLTCVCVCARMCACVRVGLVTYAQCVGSDGDGDGDGDDGGGGRGGIWRIPFCCFSRMMAATLSLSRSISAPDFYTDRDCLLEGDGGGARRGGASCDMPGSWSPSGRPLSAL